MKRRSAKSARSTSGSASRRWRRTKTVPATSGDDQPEGAVVDVLAAGDLLQPVDAGKQRHQRERRPRRGREARGRRRGGVGQQPGREQDQQRHHRHPHQERRAPPEALEQRAAEDRADGHAAHEAGQPDADRLPHLLGPLEHVPDHRHRRRHDRRAGDAEQRARQDQHLGALRERRQHGDSPKAVPPTSSSRRVPIRSASPPIVTSIPASRNE